MATFTRRSTGFRVDAALLALSTAVILASGCGRRADDVAKPAQITTPNQDLGVILAEPNVVEESVTAEAVPAEGLAAEAESPPSSGYLSSLAQSISQAYSSAKSQGTTAATSARDWLMDDLSSARRWEYKILATAETDHQKLEAELNALGRDGWQCFHVQSSDSGMTLYLQRRPPSISQNIPLSDLLKALPYLGLGQGEK